MSLSATLLKTTILTTTLLAGLGSSCPRSAQVNASSSPQVFSAASQILPDTQMALPNYIAAVDAKVPLNSVFDLERAVQLYWAKVPADFTIASIQHEEIGYGRFEDAFGSYSGGLTVDDITKYLALHSLTGEKYADLYLGTTMLGNKQSGATPESLQTILNIPSSEGESAYSVNSALWLARVKITPEEAKDIATFLDSYYKSETKVKSPKALLKSLGVEPAFYEKLSSMNWPSKDGNSPNPMFDPLEIIILGRLDAAPDEVINTMNLTINNEYATITGSGVAELIYDKVSFGQIKEFLMIQDENGIPFMLDQESGTTHIPGAVALGITPDEAKRFFSIKTPDGDSYFASGWMMNDFVAAGGTYEKALVYSQIKDAFSKPFFSESYVLSDLERAKPDIKETEQLAELHTGNVPVFKDISLIGFLSARGTFADAQKLLSITGPDGKPKYNGDQLFALQAHGYSKEDVQKSEPKFLKRLEPSPE